MNRSRLSPVSLSVPGAALLSFYHIPNDIPLIFLPPGSHETWPEISEEQWEDRIELAPSKDFAPSLP